MSSLAEFFVFIRVICGMGKGGETKKPTKAETKAAKQGLMEKNGDLTSSSRQCCERSLTDLMLTGRCPQQERAEAFAVASKTGENLSTEITAWNLF